MASSFAAPSAQQKSMRVCQGMFSSPSAPVARIIRSTRRSARSSVTVWASATLIDGKETAATIRKEIAAEVAELKAKTGKVCMCSLPTCLTHASMCLLVLASSRFHKS